MLRFQLSKIISTRSTLVVTTCNTKCGLQIKILQWHIVLTITYAPLQGSSLRPALSGANVSKVMQHVLNGELLFQLINWLWIGLSNHCNIPPPATLSELTQGQPVSAMHLGNAEITRGSKCLRMQEKPLEMPWPLQMTCKMMMPSFARCHHH